MEAKQLGPLGSRIASPSLDSSRLPKHQHFEHRVLRLVPAEAAWLLCCLEFIDTDVFPALTRFPVDDILERLNSLRFFLVVGNTYDRGASYALVLVDIH